MGPSDNGANAPGSRVVVTGGAGRLGRSVTSGLRAAGHLVLSVDRVPHADATSAVVDLTDPDAAHRVLRDFSADAVVHLAGIAVPFSAPERTILTTNATLAFTVAQAAVDENVR